MHLIPRANRPRLRPGAAAALPGALGLALAAVLSGCGSGTAPAAKSPGAAWPYYAETIPIRPPAYDSPLNLSVRATATGAESAALRVPGQSVGFVVGTGKPGRWIAGVQPWHPVGYDNSAQPARLYLATLTPEPVDGGTVNDANLSPLPAPPMRARPLIDGTAAVSSARQLAAATLSPDGRRLALVTTQGDTYQVGVYPVSGKAATRTWSGQVTPQSRPFSWGFSLTWLGDGKTLAVGAGVGSGAGAGPGLTDSTAAVRYLDTASPGSSLARAGRTVTLSFPDATAKTGTPGGCFGAPVATSDGQRVLCPGAAPVSAGGEAEAGIWVFSARTGTLTAAWNKHTVCCALSGTGLPHLLWVSPHGDLLIADGMRTRNQGAQLFLRTAGGTLEQLPWPGLTRRPGQGAIVEPSVAW